MQKTVLYGKDAREKLSAGVKKIVDAVKVTMGASGKTVLIGNAVYGNDGLFHAPNIITKDGYSVSRHFELSDSVENRGSLLIREAALKTVEQAGDATTCTCVLAGAIIESGMELIESGANSQELKRGIDIAVDNVVKELKEVAIKVAGDNNMVFQVASVSANNDAVIGKFISDAYEKIGHEGVIDIEQSEGLETEIKVSDGYKWDKGFVSRYFITNQPKETWEGENVLVLLYDKKINHHTQIQRALEICAQQGRPLIIVCEDAVEEGLATLVMNHLQKRISVCVVKSPGFGIAKTEEMEDLAVITGASYVSDIHGLSIKEVEFENFGKVKKAIISKDETVLIGGSANPESLTSLVKELKMNLTQAKTEDEKFAIEKRIAKLTGGIAVIRVGAATEPEMGEKLDRYDDAVRSTKAAIQEGVIAGGGTALVRISQKLFLTKPELSDFEKGQNLVYTALNKPMWQIVENAGLKPKDIWESVVKEKGNMGYNLKSGKVEDLIQVGIIDAAKAIRCALINAASVSGSALTSECLIVATS